MGRHPSWVSRQLLLIEQLPASALEAVRAGWLSTWSASRVLVPLARANPQHAQGLIAAVKDSPLTRRQLLGFWQHYQKANRAVRQKMAAEPGLFFKSLAARQTESPEGRWCRDLRTVEHILLRLIKTAEALLSPECSLPRTTSCALRGPLLVSTNGSLLIGAGVGFEQHGKRR